MGAPEGGLSAMKYIVRFAEKGNSKKPIILYDGRGKKKALAVFNKKYKEMTGSGYGIEITGFCANNRVKFSDGSILELVAESGG